jgi:alanine racemase
MNKQDRLGLRTWIEIDTKAIAHNYKLFRNSLKKETKLMAVVKSNAYGHSFQDFAREMVKSGADFLGVDSAVEGLALRKIGIKTPILVLGYTLPELQKEAIEADISLSVSNYEAFNSLLSQKYSWKPKVHIKVDTGMSRQGFLHSEQKKLIALLTKNKNNLNVEGLFTHFAAAKNPSFPGRTNAQIKEFDSWVSAFTKAGFKPICHASATSGTLIFKNAEYDMVRVGIGMYGLWASAEAKAFAEHKMPLKPVLTWKTIVGEVKVLNKESAVGYDFTETVPVGTKIAILPIGYWHGYPRSLSSLGSMLIRGQRAHIIGRVSMDMIICDVTKIKEVAVGDEVTLIGRDGKEEVSAEYLSGVIDASWYELVTRINPLIKRIYI